MALDGVNFVVHNVPGAEAPTELTFTISDKKAHAGDENLAQTMHNLLPVRGQGARFPSLGHLYGAGIGSSPRRRGLFWPAQRMTRPCA
jgi:hypothetical protein